MKKIYLLVFLWAPILWAQSAVKSATDPLAPLAWMVGGTWHGEISMPGNGAVTRIDTRIRRTLGGHVLAFDTNFNGSPRYEGQFAYDAVRKQIVLAYGAADGGWVEGTVQPQPAFLLWDFEVHESDGTVGHYQLHVHQDDADDYTWALFGQRDGVWSPQFQIKYHRLAD